MSKQITHWQPDIEVLKSGPSVGVCGKQGWVTMHLDYITPPNCVDCLAVAARRLCGEADSAPEVELVHPNQMRMF